MSGEYAVLKMLLEDVDVKAIVGKRVYLDQAPQTDKLPYIIVEEEDVEAKDSKDGVSALDVDIIRVYPYAETKAQLGKLAKACRKALDWKEGTFNDVIVRNIRFISQSSFDEEVTNRKVYAKDQMYQVFVKQ